MALAIKPSSVVKAVWFSIGTGAAYAAYYSIHKDLWAGARQVSRFMPVSSSAADTPFQLHCIALPCDLSCVSFNRCQAHS